MREVVETTLGKNVYKIEQLGSDQGSKVLARLMRIGGKSFAQGGVDEEGIAKVFGALFAEITDENLDFFTKTFRAVTRVSPVDDPSKEWVLKDVYDSHFVGNYGEMALWLKASVEANYGNFLDVLGLGGTVEDLMAMAMATKGPAKTSTGTSGASSPKAGAAS